MYSQPQKPNKSPNDLLRYAGLGMQLFVALGLGVFAGIKADSWLNFTIPVFAWVLPLLILCGMIYKLIRETSKRK